MLHSPLDIYPHSPLCIHSTHGPMNSVKDSVPKHDKLLLTLLVLPPDDAQFEHEMTGEYNTGVMTI
jgi:hypothetical protein